MLSARIGSQPAVAGPRLDNRIRRYFSCTFKMPLPIQDTAGFDVSEASMPTCDHDLTCRCCRLLRTGTQGRTFRCWFCCAQYPKPFPHRRIFLCMIPLDLYYQLIPLSLSTMLRINPSVITLTTGEVKAAEHRRRIRKHLERTTTFRIPERGHARDEQNIGQDPARHSSATTSPVVKSDANQFTNQNADQRALESISPQSRRSVDDYIASVDTTTSPAPESAQQRHECSTAQKKSSPMSRLLAMTPRRLGPTVRFAASSPSHAIELPSDELVDDAESSEPVVAMVTSPLANGSPELPPLFTRAIHVRSVESTTALVRGYTGKDFNNPYN